MTRLDKFLALPAEDSVRVMMSFSHSIDFARGRMSFTQWEQQLDQLAAEKTIWKLTMRDFARYIGALRALKATEAGLSNESQIAVWVRVNGKAIEIPSQTTLSWEQMQ